MFYVNPEACMYDPDKIKSEIYKQIVPYDAERYDRLETHGHRFVQEINDGNITDTIIEGLWGTSGENIISHAEDHVGCSIQELKNRKKPHASAFKEKYHMLVALTDTLYGNLETIAEWYADNDIREPLKLTFEPNQEEKLSNIGYGVKYNKETKNYDIILTPALTVIFQKNKDYGFYMDTCFAELNHPRATTYKPTLETNIEEQITTQLDIDYLEDTNFYDVT